MKILCVGDIHIKKDNTHDIEIFTTKLEEYLIENKDNIDLVVFMGDILHDHEKLSTDTVNRAVNVFERIKAIKEVYVLVGNHDYINNTMFLTSHHWMNCLKWIVTVIDKVVVKKFDDCILTFTPYVSSGRFKEALNTNLEWTSSAGIFAHQTLDGGRDGGYLAENVEKWDLDAIPVFSGHLHDAQHPQPNIYYTGACLQHAFSEGEDKTLSLLTFRKNKFRSEEKVVLEGLPRKKILHKMIEELSTKELIDEIEFKENTIYKIKINCTYFEYKAFCGGEMYRYLKKFKQIKKIEYDTKKTASIETKTKENNPLKKVDMDYFKEVLREEVDSRGMGVRKLCENLILGNDLDKNILLVERCIDI